jgi:hypothetical protein
MSSDRTIVDAIKVAQDLLRQNLPPTHNFTDAATVMRFRELVRSQAIRSALDRSSDTLLTFALREVERVHYLRRRCGRPKSGPRQARNARAMPRQTLRHSSVFHDNVRATCGKLRRRAQRSC